MRVMAQMAMVMNLDKCIGCHTCSVTCKQAWTNRTGTEYVWFNNVETRPGLGYPRTYEDQEEWQGGWVRKPNGRIALRRAAGSRSCSRIFSNPKLPSIHDYYEPWTYDYETLLNSPHTDTFPVARPKSLLTGKDMNVEWSANWDDDLGGSQEHAARDVMLQGIEDKVKLEFEQTFMFYLPRICEHCLNPSCAASCPSRRDLQARGGRHRPRRPGQVPRLAHVRLRLPLQEDLLQPQDRQGREVHVLLPAHRGRHPDRLRGDLRGPAALHRPRPLRRRQGARGRVDRGRARPLRGPARGLPRPRRPRGRARGRGGRHPRRLDRGRPEVAGAGALINDYEVALPLHPEYRTMPMVWYIPPLSPVVDVVKDTGHDAEDTRQPLRRDRHAADPRRVPRQPLHRRRPRAGDPGAQEARGDALLHARHQPRPRPRRLHPRGGRHVGGGDVRDVPAAGASPSTTSATSSRRRTPSRPTRWRSWPPTAPSTDQGGGQQDLFGEGSGYPTPVAVENFRMLQDRQTVRHAAPRRATRRRGSTCSTGTARAAPRASSRQAEGDA